MNRIGVLFIFVLVLTACAPDPRKEGEARVMVIEAEQRAKDSEQARQIAREQADAEKAKAEYQQIVWDSALGTVQASANTLVRFVGWSLTIALCVVALGAGWTVTETSRGLGRTFVRFSEVRAGLIHMDKSTRTFPAFVDVREVHGTRVIAMLSNGLVLKLDAAQPADRQMIAALGQVAALGVAMQEMRGSNDAAGMAVFQPEVIGAHEGALTVGREFIEALKEGVR